MEAAGEQKYGIWRSVLLNAFWIPLFFQDTALAAIAVPAALAQIVPQDHVRADAVVVALMNFVSMLVPPIAGAISDKLRLRGIPRRTPILVGAAVNAIALILLAEVHGLGGFITLVLLATMGNNIALAAYQPLIPDVVPPSAWGMVSGVRSVAMLAGSVVGLGVGAGTTTASTFIGMGIAVALGALTLFAIEEPRMPDHPEEHAHVSDWHDFTVVFLARAFLAFGVTLLMTFVLYFFRDILHVGNPSAGTGFVAMAALGGAVISGIYLGWLSDRVPRKIIVALCGIPMVLAAAGFATFPEEHSMYAFGVLFGIGFGGIMSTGWALAIDSVPKLRDVARDLGIWGIAQNFPAAVAPLAGGLILNAYAGSLPGYRVLFFAAAGCFALGSATVLAVGLHPLIPWWGAPLRIASALALRVNLRKNLRIRSWGALPPGRGPSLIIANHQMELDLLGPAQVFTVRGGRNPMLTACAKLMYEPGFMAIRFPQLWRVLHNVNFGWLFEGMGMLPLENQLQSRSVARWAWGAQRRHGVVDLSALFKPEVVERLSLQGLTSRDLFRSEHFKRAQESYVRLSDLQVRYRKEAFDDMRAGVDADIARIEDAVKRGASFFVTPEGEYTHDGAMLPFRGIWDRLAPHAPRVFLVGISYDPFAGPPLSQLYRIVELREKASVVDELKAARPVTVSALLSEWLVSHPQPFDEAQAVAALVRRLQSLPESIFIDPGLLGDPQRTVREALRHMCEYGILRQSGAQFTISESRKHPDFPEVEDILAFQATFFAETLQGVERSGGLGEGRPSAFNGVGSPV